MRTCMGSTSKYVHVYFFFHIIILTIKKKACFESIKSWLVSKIINAKMSIMIVCLVYVALTPPPRH